MTKYLLAVVTVLGMAACNNNNDPNPSQAKINEAKTVAVNGQWVITYFWDTDKDETANFADFVFDFKADGSITATKGATVVSGQWTVTDEDDDDKVDENVDVNLIFSTPADFEQLTEDWHIISISDTKIELTHTSGGGGGTDLLTFTKN